MTPAQVLKEVPITRRKLYYLEEKQFITPKKKRAGDHEFRDYSPDDLKKIRAISKYLEEGYRFHVAREKAEKDLNSHY